MTIYRQYLVLISLCHKVKGYPEFIPEHIENI